MVFRYGFSLKIIVILMIRENVFIMMVGIRDIFILLMIFVFD